MKKFKPHMMYDPKTGKGYKAEKPEDHERMAKMGYTHDKPKEGKGFQPAMMLNPKTKAEILAKRKKKMDEGAGLWHNIHMKRKRGEKMRKKGAPGAPTQAAMDRAKGKHEDTTTADAGIPHDTKNMGPRIKTTVMHDRRRKKDQKPILLKRFRKYIEDKGII